MEHTAEHAEPGAPLRVGYLGNFRAPWCTEVHVTASLEQLGHKVFRWQEDQTPWSTIPQLVERNAVQLLVWQRTWPAAREVVEPELQRLRDVGVRSVSYHLDRWWGLDREHQVDEQGFFRTDLVVSPDDSPRWAEAGVNHLWMPPAVYGPECAPVAPDPRRYPWEVVFVGSHPYPHAEWEPTRTAVIDAMAAEFGPRFAVLPGRHAPDVQHPLGKPKPQIRNRQLQVLYATAKVVVGDSCLAGETHRYWSDRVPETLGRGGALVHPDAPGLADYYTPGRDLQLYTPGYPADAVTTVQALLDLPEAARSMADRGRATVLGRDLYTHRMAQLIDHLHAELPLPAPKQVARRSVPPRPARSRARSERTPLAGVPGYRHVVRHKQARQPGRFELAEGTTDLEALHEVWTRDDYRLRAEHVRGKRVVDVGANVGAFTVLAAQLGAAEVHAYEPHPANAEVLRRNLATNRVDGRVTVHQAAVTGGAHPEGLLLNGEGGGASLTMPMAGDGAEHTAVVVETVQAELVLGDVHYIKLDCEGAEYGILDAVPDSVLEHTERIAMEFHGPAMPHLAALNADGGHLERWQAMVGRLANFGRVEVFGRPMVGGLLWWSRY